jgi:hypothetical protein
VTAICGGGASSFKPQLAATQFVTPAVANALLNNIPVAWAVPFAAYIALKTYDLSVFCAVDPPADPGFTALDAIALLNVYNPFVSGPAGAKFQQLVDRYAWYAFCQCTSVTTPAPPAAPAAPVGLPQINAPVGTPPTAGACWDKLATGLVGGTTALAKNYTDQLVPPGATHSQNNTGMAGLATAIPLPLPTSITVTTTTDAGGGTSQIDFNWGFFNAAGAQVGGNTVTLNPASTFVTNQAIPATAVYWWFGIDEAGTPNTLTCSMRLQAWCAGTSPTTVAAPCCPPDPLLTGMLNQILGLVTLLQRQTAPFAYLASTVHAGLSGAGTISIQGLLGVKTVSTARPTSLGQTGTSPTEFFELGWLSFGTADGYPHSVRLEHDPQLVLPARCSAFTSLAYDLHPGVTLTITELVREP